MNYILLVVDGSFSKFIAESSLRRKRERCLGFDHSGDL